jgi:hypothetical protein
MKKQLPLLCLLALIGAFVFSLEGCHDKCEDSHSTSAEFKVYNELNYYDKENGNTVQKTKIVEEDTFMVNNYVNFEALDQNADSYEWTIGSDPKKRTEKKFTLFFDNLGVISENPLPIKLKIKKAPNTQCFPNDNGVDSITHRIYLIPIDKWPVYGKYTGFDDTDPNGRFTIEIYRDSKTGEIFISNLPNACNPNNPGVRLAYPTSFEFVLTDFPAPLNYFPPLTINCFFRQYDKKIGYLTPGRKDIVIDYEFTEGGVDETQKKHRIFKGKRI